MLFATAVYCNQINWFKANIWAGSLIRVSAPPGFGVTIGSGAAPSRRGAVRLPGDVGHMPAPLKNVLSGNYDSNEGIENKAIAEAAVLVAVPVALLAHLPTPGRIASASRGGRCACFFEAAPQRRDERWEKVRKN